MKSFLVPFCPEALMKTKLPVLVFPGLSQLWKRLGAAYYTEGIVLGLSFGGPYCLEGGAAGFESSLRPAHCEISHTLWSETVFGIIHPGYLLRSGVMWDAVDLH